MSEVFEQPEKINLMILVAGLHIGGAEVVIQRLAENIDSDKFNLTICCIKGRGSIGDTLAENGYDIVTLTDPGSNKTDYLTFVKLLRVIREKRIEVIHSHTVDALSDAAVCRLLVPRLRLVHTFHYGNYPRSEKRLMWLERVFSRMANRLVAVGEVQKQQIKKALWFSDHRVDRVWNGVRDIHAEDGAAFKKRIGAEGCVLIGSIATLTEQKGLRDLIEVARQFRGREHEIRFVVVGEGPLRSELDALVQHHGLNDLVVLPGWIQDAAEKALPAFDIFFMSSLWEAMSIAILEAMAAGKAIVATRVGENPHVLDDGVEGVLVDRGDIRGMKEAIERLVCDPKYRVKLGQAAACKVRQRFTIQQMTDAYETIYQEMLGRRAASKNTQNAA